MGDRSWSRIYREEESQRALKLVRSARRRTATNLPRRSTKANWTNRSLSKFVSTGLPPSSRARSQRPHTCTPYTRVLPTITANPARHSHPLLVVSHPKPHLTLPTTRLHRLPRSFFPSTLFLTDLIEHRRCHSPFPLPSSYSYASIYRAF